MRTVYVALALSSIVTASSCGNTTTAPSTLTGIWAGYVVYTVNGVTGSQNISMTLTQTGTSITGSYYATSAGYFSLTMQQPVQGTTSLSFTGSLDFLPGTGVDCAGEIGLTGSPAGSELEWTGTTTASTCGTFAPTGVLLQLTRLP